MNRTTQLALLDRVQAHRASGRETDTAATVYQQPVSAYTSLDRHRAELAMLTRMPTMAGFSDLLPAPGSFATADVGASPVVMTRDDEGRFRAFLNVCRHRGAPVAEGCGTASRLTCPYHGWTYHLDGSAAARRRPSYFEDVEPAALTELPSLEHHGMLWVSGTPGATIPADPLHGCGDDMAEFGLADHRLFTSTTFTRPINWKLVMDTFLEVYHIAVLHRNTIDPTIHSDYALFDPFGPHGRMIVTRKSISELDRLPRDDWPFFAHTTLVWMLVPNTVLIYQQDHMQVYQSWPTDRPGESRITVSIWVPKDTTRSDEHWQKNFDLLVEVTDTEDFVACAAMQRGFASGAQDHLTFGRNEPLLQHFEKEVAGLLG